jgi:hypothetical protein
MARGQDLCHRLSPSVTAFSDGRSVTVCHRLSPSVTCARKNLNSPSSNVEAKRPLASSLLEIPQVTHGDTR